MKKSERLIFLMNLLGSGCSYSAADLAAKCEVSLRTIYRDINDLSIHCTVYYDDGYRLLNIRETVVSPFSPIELLAMRLAIEFPPIADIPGYGNAARSASKRLDELLANYDGEGDGIGDSIDISVDSLDHTALRLFAQLEKAIVDKRLLSVKYLSIDGGETERVIAPVYIIFRRHNWYLIAYCYKRRDYCLFRVNRFVAIEETGDNYTIEKPDMGRFFDDAWEMAVSGEIYDISLLFESNLATLVESSYAHKGTIKRLSNGKVRFSARVKGLFEIKNWVMRFGAGVKVEEPPELVESIENEVKAMNKLYGIKNG